MHDPKFLSGIIFSKISSSGILSISRSIKKQSKIF